MRKAAGHAGEVICVCQSVGSSFTRVSAEVAIRRVQRDGIVVRLISPGRSTAGLGAICIAAARAANNGRGPDDVFGYLEELTAGADSYAIPAGLGFLENTGALDMMSSQSAIGLSIIYVEFDWGTPIMTARQVVQERLSSATGALPAGGLNAAVGLVSGIPRERRSLPVLVGLAPIGGIAGCGLVAAFGAMIGIGVSPASTGVLAVAALLVGSLVRSFL